MNMRVALTVLYGVVLGAVLALDNFVAMPDILKVAVWLLAPVVGFLVGRWWAVLAVVGALVGRAIGWEAAEHDGNSAIWPPYVVSMIALIGIPLLLGVVISFMRNGNRQRHQPA